MNTQDWVARNTLHMIISGSRLYGTYRPDSDFDYRGVCAMPREALLGLEPFEQFQSNINGLDREVYGLTKFVRLALENNPNIVDILFAQPDRWLVQSEEWSFLYGFRHAFLSQKLRHTFSGYAFAQLKRLEGHRKWLLNPPDHQPTPEEYRCHIINTAKGGQLLVSDGSDEVNKRNYQGAMQQWQQYQTWLAERNPKRAATERLVGYDTKNAAHLVRLLVKAKEALTVCDYNPVLEGNDLCFVKQVLEGKILYQDLIAFTTDMEAQVKQMPTNLPHSPKYDTVHTVLMVLNERALKESV